MRQPQRLPLDAIYYSLPDELRNDRKLIGFRDGMGVAVNINNYMFHRLKLASSPFLIEDYRMGIVKRGMLRGVINLREYTMREGTAVFITPGTIVEPLDVSDDFLMEGMGLPYEKFLLAHNGKLPELFNGQIRDGRRVISEQDEMIIDRMLLLLHDLMERGNIADQVVYNMVSTVSHFYDLLFSDRQEAQPPSHSGEIFNSFLRLVNLHGRREHQLAFYAERLCITSRYLGTVVMQTSGVGAKQWIDRAIVSAAKVMLRHSDKQTAQIADELNFPNASFFCKYFKRLTGVTPLQYRNKKDGADAE